MFYKNHDKQFIALIRYLSNGSTYHSSQENTQFQDHKFSKKTGWFFHNWLYASENVFIVVFMNDV